jgi:DNA-binding CsgD family transcriptional regulator
MCKCEGCKAALRALPYLGPISYFCPVRYTIITFGIICLCSLVLLQMAKVALIKETLPVEILIGFFAAIFLLAGILIARRQQPAAPAHIQDVPAQPPHNLTGIDHNKINELGISKREYEVLCAIASGMSNSEIAEKLYVSESTIKTHISNLLFKLDARRRTEAVHKAKELKILI